MTMAARAVEYSATSKTDRRLFDAVKSSVSVRDAAERYGIPVNRRGMCQCPFHKDRNPSMKVDKRYHCFGCQADGDVISFTSRLFGFNRKAAAYKLASDFGIRADGRETKLIPFRRPVTEETVTEHRAAHYFRELSDYRNQLVQWSKEYTPKSPEEDFHPRFVEALMNLPAVENDLDILLSGDIKDKQMVIADLLQKEKEVKPMKAAVTVPVYYESGAYARDHKELELFRSSHMENINCKKAVEASIARNFDGMRLNKSAVTEVLDQYGPERLSLVLASTVQIKSWDGRFSQQNKDWAFTVRMPDSRPDMNYDRRDAYAVTSHPAVLDGFISHARREIQDRQRHSVLEDLNKSPVQSHKPTPVHASLER